MNVFLLAAPITFGLIFTLMTIWSSISTAHITYSGADGKERPCQSLLLNISVHDGTCYASCRYSSQRMVAEYNTLCDNCVVPSLGTTCKGCPSGIFLQHWDLMVYGVYPADPYTFYHRCDNADLPGVGISVTFAIIAAVSLGVSVVILISRRRNLARMSVMEML